MPEEHVASCGLAGAERVPIAPRIAERGQVPVLDAGDGERLAQPPLREARLARDRVLPHVEDDLDAVIHQLGDELVELTTLVPDRHDGHRSRCFHVRVSRV